MVMLLLALVATGDWLALQTHSFADILHPCKRRDHKCHNRRLIDLLVCRTDKTGVFYRAVLLNRKTIPLHLFLTHARLAHANVGSP